MPVTAPRSGLVLRGRRYPYIYLDELADWLNSLAHGRSTWTAEHVRRHLSRFPGVLQQDPPRPSAATDRRPWWTTLELLQQHCPPIAKALLQGADSDDDAADLLTEDEPA